MNGGNIGNINIFLFVYFLIKINIKQRFAIQLGTLQTAVR